MPLKKAKGVKKDTIPIARYETDVKLRDERILELKDRIKLAENAVRKQRTDSTHATNTERMEGLLSELDRTKQQRDALAKKQRDTDRAVKDAEKEAYVVGCLESEETARFYQEERDEVIAKLKKVQDERNDALQQAADEAAKAAANETHANTIKKLSKQVSFQNSIFTEMKKDFMSVEPGELPKDVASTYLRYLVMRDEMYPWSEPKVYMTMSAYYKLLEHFEEHMEYLSKAVEYAKAYGLSIEAKIRKLYEHELEEHEQRNFLKNLINHPNVGMVIDATKSGKTTVADGHYYDNA